MAVKDPIVCHVCGFKNGADAARCVSCGAKLEAVAADYSVEEEAARKNQQAGFEVKWVVAAFAIYFVFQAIALAVLPAIVPAYDPFQNVWGILISSLTWFIGGIVAGLVSPGRTFLEPAVAAVIAVIPTIAYLMWRTPGEPGDGFDPSIMAYTVGGLIGVMVSLFGAFIGEKIQGATRGHRATRT
ncbi:MAG: zinc finger Ran-binding domain-containing protein [Myxococcota bacterium]|nr:zinc finger Ran-binding domain-containing protein [Myxococcota bacterium]